MSYLREKGRPAPDRVHLDDCSMASKRIEHLPRNQARGILAEGRVDACPHCRPETDLGLQS
ncbi:DUF6233 domain-containing protein [Streptomyces hydrogenans]|uniref:DUF6233 domain-containing protein n=1 Tax=Streptomyces hydrogenans TaxID=1873719 RepID=UPI0037FA9A64